MATTTQSTLVGVFHEAENAREAIRALRQAGFAESQIGVVSRRGEDDPSMIDTDDASNSATGLATGAGVGAGVAALWSLGVTFGMLPVIGPILAAGPIAAALISAAGGAAAGGLVGALIGTGISEEDASYYEGEFQSGRTLVTVKADGRNDEAWAILRRHGAYSRQTAASRTPSVSTLP